MYGNCRHCGQECNYSSEFCCNGCKVAYHIIESLDLTNFYKFCRNVYNVSPNKVQEYKIKIDFRSHVEHLKDDAYRVNLLVDGMVCGSCVWLLENTLAKQEGVKYARVNLSTKRFVIEWEGKAEQVDEFANVIFQLGYKATPFTVSEYEIVSKQDEEGRLIDIAVSGFASVAMMMTIWAVWSSLLDDSMGSYATMLMNIIASLIAIPSILFASRSFFKSAFYALKNKASNMDVPISIAIITTTLISIQETILGSKFVYYDAAVSLIFFLLVGRYLDIRTRNKARQFASNIILTQPKAATLIDGNDLLIMPYNQLKVGDKILVNSGEKFPTDVVLIDGNTSIDMSEITGESVPVDSKVGDKIAAGSINAGYPVKCEVLAVGADSTLGQILHLLEQAEQGRAKYVMLADRISRWYTPVVLVASALTLGVWLFKGALISKALLIAVSVLIITCPCALGLAVPIVQVITSSRAMSSGILIKAQDALEKLPQVDYVVFDKTGTLTKGAPSFINAKDFSDHELEIIRTLALYSSHPLCKAIAQKGNIEFDEMPKEERGKGVVGFLHGKEVRIGSRSFLGIETAEEHQYMEMCFEAPDGKIKILKFEDELRDGAQELVRYLEELGIPTMILSGDRALPVKLVAEKLGVKNYAFQNTPEAKSKFLKDLKAAGHHPLMVGDGINDAVALKEAFISASLGSATEIAQNYADVVVTAKSLKKLIALHKSSKFANRLILENFAMSLVYNILTIPVAMLGYATPVVAAIVMSSSSILVVLNSLRKGSS